MKNKLYRKDLRIELENILARNMPLDKDHQKDKQNILNEVLPLIDKYTHDFAEDLIGPDEDINMPFHDDWSLASTHAYMNGAKPYHFIEARNELRKIMRVLNYPK